MKLRVQTGTAPFRTASETHTIQKLVGVTSEQVDKIYKFVKSDQNEARLLDGWMFETGPGSGSSSLRIIKIEKANSDGDLFTVELKIPRYASAYKTTMCDDKDYGYVELPIGIVLIDLFKELGWVPEQESSRR